MRALLQNKIVRFLLLAAGLYLFWLLLYYFVIKTYTDWDFWLNYLIVENAQSLLALFKVSAFIEIDSDQVILVLSDSMYHAIRVGDECNGFKLFSIFSIFIIAFPGSWKKKAWFIPMGLVIVHLANVIRVALLLLINNYYHEYMDFNHLYTFTVFVYAIIFLLWYWYAKKHSAYASKS
ncbi:MAG: archaeosortase/exosortase family protein [Crocinitomicaceae bacterium]